MKKKSILGIVFLGFLALTSCAKDNANVKAVSMPLYNYNEYYELKENKLDTYFIEDSKVPYVSVNGYINALNGMLDSSKYSFSANSLFQEYIVRTNFSNTKLSIIFDYKNDKILSVYDYAFQNTVNIEETIDYSYNLKTQTKSIYNGKTISFDLAKYDFDMRYINGNCLVPYQIMNALFGSINYNSTYYTGKSYYNTYFSVSYASNGDEIIKKMKEDSTGEVDDLELRKSNYNFLCFYMDYFYGLKSTKNISTFDSYLSDDTKTDLLSKDPNTYMKGYAKMIQSLNELHTSMHSKSLTTDMSISFTSGDFATPNFVKYNKTKEELTEKAKQAYNTNLSNEIKLIGNTCYIFFKNFQTAKTDKVKDENGKIKDDAYLYDTYYLFYEAIEKIKLSQTKIDNIVVDLSLNGGGNAGAQYRALGFINNSIDLSQRNALSQVGFTQNIKVDTNNDGEYDSLDSYKDYNWYILTSVCSYSSANLFTHHAKNNNANVKVLGEAAGGGGCSILPLVFIDGTSLQISGINQYVNISERGTSYTYEVLENGLSVDYPIEYKYYYDRDYINNIINK